MTFPCRCLQHAVNVRTVDIRTGTCCTCAPSGAGGASHSTGSFREDFAEGARDRLRVKQTKVSLRVQEVWRRAAACFKLPGASGI